MYRIMAVLKSGICVTVAESETLEDIDHRTTSLDLMMSDMTSTKQIFRDGLRLTAVKEIAATWVEEFNEGDDDE